MKKTSLRRSGEIEMMKIHVKVIDKMEKRLRAVIDEIERINIFEKYDDIKKRLVPVERVLKSIQSNLQAFLELDKIVDRSDF